MWSGLVKKTWFSNWTNMFFYLTMKNFVIVNENVSIIKHVRSAANKNFGKLTGFRMDL